MPWVQLCKIHIICFTEFYTFFLFVLLSFITPRFQLYLQLQWNCQSHLQSIWNQIIFFFSKSELFSGSKWIHLKSKLKVNSLLQVFMKKCQVVPVSLQMLQVLSVMNGSDSKLKDQSFSWTILSSVIPVHYRVRHLSRVKHPSLWSVHLWHIRVKVGCVLFSLWI